MNEWIFTSTRNPEKNGTYEVYDPHVFDEVGIINYDIKKGWRIPKESQIKAVVKWRYKESSLNVAEKDKIKISYTNTKQTYGHSFSIIKKTDENGE